MQTTKTDTCCPPFDPSTYDNKTHDWKDKLFIRDTVAQIFHIPLNMAQVITRMWQKVESSNAKVEDKDFLMLAFDPSPWKSEISMTVSEEIPFAKNVRISGKFISKVFDGPYNAVPQWIGEFDRYLGNKSLKAKKYYFYYTTCPKCAKKYGHNYVVAFAEI